MAEMTKRLVFPSSFDSTRYTAVHPRDDHPNLAQAHAEAVTTLLLGRPLGLTNTYALDSRTVLNLIRETLEAREAVRETATTGERERIDNADPVKLRWYAPTADQKDFLSCCAGSCCGYSGQDGSSSRPGRSSMTATGPGRIWRKS